jgi:hypothetical protein
MFDIAATLSGSGSRRISEHMTKVFYLAYATFKLFLLVKL